MARRRDSRYLGRADLARRSDAEACCSPCHEVSIAAGRAGGAMMKVSTPQSAYQGLCTPKYGAISLEFQLWPLLLQARAVLKYAILAAM